VIREKKLKQRGFTLPELAIALLFTGATMMAGTQFTRIYTMTVKREKTIENLEMVYDALEEYAALNGAYPCPANPAASPGDADYGVSKCRDTTSALFDEDNCVSWGGVECTTIGSRDTDLNDHNDVVLMGAIPFKELISGTSDTPIRGFHKTDGYGALISYAVTEKLTKTYPQNNLSSPYNPLLGAINMRDENMNSLMHPESEAQFVIFSHGMDNVGGYSQNGKLMENCFVPSVVGAPPDMAPVPGLYGGQGKVQTENCDNNDAIFVKGLLSLGDNNNYLDDYLYYKGRGIDALWERSIASPPGESYIYNTNLGNVGVGTSKPDSKLHIMGDISAERSLISPTYCDPGKDPTLGECLDPLFLAADIEDIAGNTRVNTCPPGEVAYAIGNNELKCRSVDWNIPNKTCQNIVDPNDGISKTSFLQGFSNLGNLYCCLADGENCEKQCGGACPCNQVECTCDTIAGTCQCVEGTCP